MKIITSGTLTPAKYILQNGKKGGWKIYEINWAVLFEYPGLKSLILPATLVAVRSTGYTIFFVVLFL